MREASPKSRPKICGDSLNVISSPASGFGVTPLERLDGQMILPCGPDHAPVNRSVRRASRKEAQMNAISGQSGIALSSPVAPGSSSRSKSPAASSSAPAMKRCSVCCAEKPLSQFRRYSGRTPDGYRPLCKVCQRDYEKDWRSRSGEKLRKARWIRSPQAKEYSRRHRAEKRAAYLIAECRRRCARRGVPFDLDVQQIQARIDVGRCEVTGYALDVSPLTERYQHRPNSPSLDRINPKKGYVMSNVRVVCLAVNTALGNWGEAAFLPILKAWAEKAA